MPSPYVQSGQRSAVQGNVPNPIKSWLRYYEYNTSFLNVTANTGTANGNIQLQNDADFYCTQIKGVVFDHTALTVLATPNATLQITDGGSNFPLFFAVQNWSNVVGTAQLPYVLPVPYKFRRASTIVFAIADLRAAGNAGDYYITLAGYKKFTPGDQVG